MDVDDVLSSIQEPLSEIPESLVSEADQELEIEIRNQFIENLVSRALVPLEKIDQLFKIVKRPRRFKEMDLPKSTSTILSIAGKHFIAYMLQMGLEKHLKSNIEEFQVDYDDMAEACHADPRLEKMNAILPLRMTIENAVKKRKIKFENQLKAIDNEIIKFSPVKKRAKKIKEKKDDKKIKLTPIVEADHKIEEKKEKNRKASKTKVDEPTEMIMLSDEVVPASPLRKSFEKVNLNGTPKSQSKITKFFGKP